MRMSLRLEWKGEPGHRHARAAGRGRLTEGAVVPATAQAVLQPEPRLVVVELAPGLVELEVERECLFLVARVAYCEEHEPARPKKDRVRGEDWPRVEQSADKADERGDDAEN